MSKLLTNDLYKQFLLTQIGNKEVGVKEARINMSKLSDFCKAEDIDLATSLKNCGIVKAIENHTIADFNDLAKANVATYTTATEGINVELILNEYMRQQIVMQQNPNAIHRLLTARVIPVDSADIRITTQKRITDDMVNLANVEEGANLPVLTNLAFDSEVLTLGKVGGEIVLAYEVVTSSKINLLTAHYQAVADIYDLTLDKNIINVILNGHTVNAAKGSNGRGGAIVSTVKSISVANLVPVIKYFSKFNINFKYAVMNLNTLSAVLGVDQFSTPILYDTAITGKLATFLGTDVLISEEVADNNILFVDPTKAVEKYEYWTLSSEGNRNIENQTLIKTFYEKSGFALVNPNAATKVVIDNTAAENLEIGELSPVE